MKSGIKPSQVSFPQKGGAFFSLAENADEQKWRKYYFSKLCILGGQGTFQERSNLRIYTQWAWKTNRAGCQKKIHIEIGKENHQMKQVYLGAAR